MKESAAARGAVFDWGGVLIEDPAPGLAAYCAERLGVTPEEFAAAFEKLGRAFQKGEVAEDEFWDRVSSALKVSKPEMPSLWGDAFREVYRPREEMFALVSSLRERGLKTALLSNTEAPAMDYFLQRGYGMFDVLVFSCAEGTRKPERRIYEIVLERLELAPGEVVFVDDREEYADGARAAGMKAILFEDPDRIRKDLGGLGVP